MQHEDSRERQIAVERSSKVGKPTLRVRIAEVWALGAVVWVLALFSLYALPRSLSLPASWLVGWSLVVFMISIRSFTLRGDRILSYARAASIVAFAGGPLLAMEAYLLGGLGPLETATAVGLFLGFIPIYEKARALRLRRLRANQASSQD